jgi:cell division protein ZipA
MEGLRIVLIIIGAIAIGAILIHGLWSIRKQGAEQRRQRGEMPPVQESFDNDGFDQDGIGKVRVISGSDSQTDPVSKASSKAATRLGGERIEPGLGSAFMSEPQDKGKEKVEPRLSMTATDVDDEPPAMLREQTDLFAEPKDEVSTASPQRSPDLNSSRQESGSVDKSATASQQTAANETLVDPQEVLIINVVAGSSGPLQGAVMLPCLLTLGLKFGEMSIFHRHESPAGTGPVLFSIANMVKPGTFDPEAMESFTTQGISLFMTLPCYGEAQKNFTLMLKAAEQLAAEMRGQVLDDQRNVLTRQKIQYYQERIREFERKRLLTV